MGHDGLTWEQLVREYFPQATPDQIDSILWNNTGFPIFWRTDPQAECRKQLAAYRDKIKALAQMTGLAP